MNDVTAMHWQCYECNMTFSNPQLLQKHRARFCVGGWGDPDQLMLRRGFRSEYPPGGGDLPDDPDPARYNPQSDPKVQQLAENHGRQMEHLSNRNRDLERQRDEIRRRLEDLGRRPVKGDDDSMNALLREMKDQEARNQKMLEELRRLLATQNYPVPVTETKKQQYIYPIYYGNSLVAEIAAVRQAYLQNGGNDPDILQQLAQMQAEAQAIEDSLKNKPPIVIKSKDPNNNKLFTLELENERLQRQLLLLQDQNVAAKNRRNGDREGRARVVSYSEPRKQTFTTLGPLDVRPELMSGKRLVTTTDRGFFRETWITKIDPMKEKIDSDVQNKFGYDYGTNRFIRKQPMMPPEPTRSDIGLITTLPEPSEEVVPLPRQQTAVIKPFPYNDNETPYFKNHLASRKLNRADKDLRESFNRMSQANVKGEDIQLIDEFRQRKEVLTIKNPDPNVKEDTNLKLGNTDASSDPSNAHNVPTAFEDAFFVDTSRTEAEEDIGNRTRRARPPPQPRPQLLLDRDPPKKK